MGLCFGLCSYPSSAGLYADAYENRPEQYESRLSCGTSHFCHLKRNHSESCLSDSRGRLAYFDFHAWKKLNERKAPTPSIQIPQPRDHERGFIENHNKYVAFVLAKYHNVLEDPTSEEVIELLRNDISSQKNRLHSLMTLERYLSKTESSTEVQNLSNNCNLKEIEKESDEDSDSEDKDARITFHETNIFVCPNCKEEEEEGEEEGEESDTESTPEAEYTMQEIHVPFLSSSILSMRRGEIRIDLAQCLEDLLGRKFFFSLLGRNTL